MGGVSGFSPIRQELLHTRVADEICKYIEKNNLDIGDRLPSERSLAQQLSISRNSLREALRVLEQRRIITVKNGRGMYVTSKEHGPSIFINSVKVNFLEMLEIKTTLEALALRQLVSVVTLEQLDILESKAVQMIENSNNGTYDEQLDISFHKTLINCVANHSLSAIICDMIDLFTNYWIQIGTHHDYQHLISKAVDTTALHLNIVQSLRSGDIDAVLASHARIYELDVDILSSLNKV